MYWPYALNMHPHYLSVDAVHDICVIWLVVQCVVDVCERDMGGHAAESSGGM